MTPHKKRSRYLEVAKKLAAKHGLDFDPNDWPRIWALLDQFDEPVFLYAIVDVKNGFVKFGKSVNPGARRKQLQTSHGHVLELWAFCEQGGALSEWAVHKEMARHRIGGEWFSLNADTRDVIGKIQMRAFLDN